MTAPPDRPRHEETILRTTALLLALAAASLAGCASDGPVRPVPSLRSEVVRPERHVPEGVADVRSALAEQRAETNERMNSVLSRPETIDPGSAPSNRHWYSPIFDALDVAARFSSLLF